jgi:hypothetical protein
MKEYEKEFNDCLLRMNNIIHGLQNIAQFMERGDIQMAHAELNQLATESVDSEAKVVSSRLERMIEHLLKLGYCSNQNDLNRNARQWKISIDKQRNEVYTLLQWYEKKRETNIILRVVDMISSIYRGGIRRYISASDHDASLFINKDLIPEECPWTLEELMDDEIVDLVEKLPNQTGFYQLFVEENYPWKLNCN